MRTIYLTLDANDYVISWGTTPSDNSIEIEVEDDHGVMMNPFVYQYKEGTVIFSESKQKELMAKYTTQKPSEVDLLRQEVERLSDTQKQSDMALLEFVESLMGM